MALVGGVDDLVYEPDHKRRRHRLVATGRHDVEMVATFEEGVEVDQRLARGGAGRVGSQPREESGGCRPDARALSVLGREDAAQHGHRGVALPVTLDECGGEVPDVALVDARREVRNRLAADRAAVEDGREEGAGALGPVVVGAFDVATRDVDEGARGQNSAVPAL